jgi:hypothetical protein
METKKQPKSLNPLRVGNAVFIRTVTMYHVGRIVEIADGMIVLEDASWVAWTKRFSESMRTGEFDEVEHVPGYVGVAFAGVIDVYNWPHALPVVTR